MADGAAAYAFEFHTYDATGQLIEYTTSLVDPQKTLIYSKLRH